MPGPSCSSSEPQSSGQTGSLTHCRTWRSGRGWSPTRIHIWPCLVGSGLGGWGVNPRIGPAQPLDPPQVRIPTVFPGSKASPPPSSPQPHGDCRHILSTPDDLPSVLMERREQRRKARSSSRLGYGVTKGPRELAAGVGHRSLCGPPPKAAQLGPPQPPSFWCLGKSGSRGTRASQISTMELSGTRGLTALP